jgi:hypothetical protein
MPAESSAQIAGRIECCGFLHPTGGEANAV